jgi:SprT protein
MIQPSTDVKKRISDIIKAGIDTAHKKYGVVVEMPKIIYDLKGTTAGTANYQTWTIRLNPVLLADNGDTFINDTPIHELAHLVTYLVYPSSLMPIYGKRRVHGPEWQSVMRVLGATPTRCHQMDTSGVKRKNVSKFTYTCKCGTSHQISAKVHNNIVRGARYICRKCRTAIFYAGNQQVIMPVEQPTPVVVTPAPTLTAALNIVGTTKIERAKYLMRTQNNLSRGEMIALFISRLNMTKAGASTYYSSLRGQGF